MDNINAKHILLHLSIIHPKTVQRSKKVHSEYKGTNNNIAYCVNNYVKEGKKITKIGLNCK